jgi:hypothetical protein
MSKVCKECRLADERTNEDWKGRWVKKSEGEPGRPLKGLERQVGGTSGAAPCQRPRSQQSTVGCAATSLGQSEMRWIVSLTLLRVSDAVR